MGKIPNWYKGKMIEDDMTGEWAEERSGKILYDGRRKIWVLKKNYDTLTDSEREEQIQRRKR